MLAEPAMTNMGIVLPDAGYHDALRELTREHGTLLIIDETHTFSRRAGRVHGGVGRWSRTCSRSARRSAAACRAGRSGFRAAVEERLLAAEGADYVDTGGVGGTLAGNALSLAAMRATLGSVLTDDVWEHTIPLAARFADGVRRGRRRDWSVTQLGCRAEYRFRRPARNGTEAHAASDSDLERYLHLHALNRGVLITPFHNMALMAPTTTAADVDRHTEVFAEAVSRSGR